MASKQKLSPKAAKAKAIRDKACAMTPDRKAKKADSQRKRSAAKKKGANLDGQDYDHKRQGFVSVKSNRGNEGAGTQKEGGANYNTN